MPDVTLQIQVEEAFGIKSSGSLLSGNNLYVAIKIDGLRVAKSNSVKVHRDAVRWDFQTDVNCGPNVQELELEVKRPGLMSDSHIGGFVVPIKELQDASNQVMTIWDASAKEVGFVRVSFARVEHSHPQHAFSSSGGLVNRVAHPATDLRFQGVGNTAGQSSTSLGLRPNLQHAGSLISYDSRTSAHSTGLANYARGSSMSSSAQPEMISRNTSSIPSAANPVRHGLIRAGTEGLANVATTVPRAVLSRAEELLEDLSTSSGEERRQKLTQAVEHLRHTDESELNSSTGRSLIEKCSHCIEVIFEEAISSRSDKEANAALWLAGRVPSLEDDSEASLQDNLRKQWDRKKMTEAFEKLHTLLPVAASGGKGLEDFMDTLDLAEFHGLRAQEDSALTLSNEMLARLRPSLLAAAQRWLSEERLDEVEHTISVLGSVKVENLGLHPVQQELQRRRAIGLLNAALLPSTGQVGFPILKQLQLRHAILMIRNAIADDASTAVSVEKLLLQDVLPACVAHSNESAVWAVGSALDLRCSQEQVWDTTHVLYHSLPTSRKKELNVSLWQLCRELSQDAPSWLLTADQAECKSTLRLALKAGNAMALQAACQRVIETPGGSDACREEMKVAITSLRKEFRIPAAWSVEAMFRSDRLLAKNEITDRRLVSLFDDLVRSTAQPNVRTRDRRGLAPRSFAAVQVVQVMNATSWASYLQRRDEIARECRSLNARYDENFWLDDLNGELMSMTVLGSRTSSLNAATPLMTEVNECWLMHGTSHEAADGITTEDFDLTRANAAGLFGAGIYFAESVSKSDEYVRGRQIAGEELFPLLVCRVCLGNIFYCDTRNPDKRELENRCLSQQWHSVLGDRKKASGTFREFIVYDNLQAFPAYIVYYRRIH